MKKLVLTAAGFMLITVGLVGVIVPVMPGWSLIFFGLLLIAPRTAWKVRGIVERRLFKKDILYFPEWKRFGVDAGVTTRHFCLSLKKTDELLDPQNQDQLKVYLSTSPELLRQKASLAGGFVYLQQVHGGRVEVFSEAEMGEGQFHRLTQADGVVTNQSRATLLVFTADCLSVFLCVVPKSSGRASWVGVVHAGWRGSRERIVREAARILREKSGCDPSEIHAILGPCIGKDRYEVGPEFTGLFSDRSLRKKGGKLFFDLFSENRAQLLEEGVLPGNIASHSICTVAGRKNFYSFRMEKDAAGRMISFIRLQKMRE